MSGFSRTTLTHQPSLLQSDDAADHDSANGTRAVVLTSVALAMTGLASLGMEILWFRHFNILLGGFRAVFSLLLALILVGIGAGSFIGGAVFRRSGRPAEWLMIAQGLFVASSLFGFAVADVNVINNDPAGTAPGSLAPGGTMPAVGALAEIWFNAKPMLAEILIPALLMGFSFPLGNAVIQHAERSVGRRAGVLYLANTVGAVCGSLVAGFVLLPDARAADGHDHPDGPGDTGDCAAVLRVRKTTPCLCRRRLPSQESRLGCGRSFQPITSRCARLGAPQTTSGDCW